MATTQADYDRLKKAYQSGRLEIRYGDNVVKYRSLAEMAALLREMQLELGQVPRGWTVDVIRHGKGLT